MKMRIASIFLIISLLSFLFYKIISGIRDRKVAERNVVNLPVLPFQFLKKGDDLYDNNVVINYFDPICDHCRFMAEELYKHRDRFTKTAFIMVTESREIEVLKFIRDYKLSQISFLSVAIDTAEIFYKNYASRIAPSFFIYSKHHNLIGSIKGETKIENILGMINE